MFNFKKLLSSLVEKVKSYSHKSKSKKENEKIIEQLEKQNELLQKQIEKQNKTLEAFVEQQRKQSNLFEELQKQNIELTQEIKEIKENKKSITEKEKENKKSITEKEKEKYKEKTELLRFSQRKQKKIEESLKDFSIKEIKQLIEEQLEDLIISWAGNGSSYLVYLNDALAKFNELTKGTEENYNDFIMHVAKYYESLDVSSINSDYVDRLTSAIFNYGYIGTNSDFIQDETVSTVYEIINKL
ncbi:MAG: hypothetical protein ACI4VH_02960 [Clostridia bacterium]